MNREIEFKIGMPNGLLIERTLEEMFEISVKAGNTAIASFPLYQFTGLIDKNDRKIYEGDIVAGKETIAVFLDRDEALGYKKQAEPGKFVRLRDGINTSMEGDERVTYGQPLRVVEWKDSSCGYEPFSDSEDNCGHCGGGENPRNFEVIGTVFENPELLEAAN